MRIQEIVKELKFKAVRSSGAGGQHVNKVSSKVELYFDVQNSIALSQQEKELLHQKLANKLTKDHILILAADDSRSQHKNKEIVVHRFLNLLKENLKKPKQRRPTKPSRAAIRKNVEKSKKHSAKKQLRKKPDF